MAVDVVLFILGLCADASVEAGGGDTRITEDSDARITEAGDTRITETA